MHNKTATDAIDCTPCLEILTDPSYKSMIAAFAIADREHFDE